MALKFHPKKGQILMCDFSYGFIEPEMVKHRPVVVFRGKGKLVTVIPLSTVKPSPIEKYHMLIPHNELPKTKQFSGTDSWLKGDMIYTVGFHRLDLIQLPKMRGEAKRKYYVNQFSTPLLSQIEKCVLNGIGLNRLEKHL